MAHAVRVLRWLLVLGGLAMVPGDAFAHRLDEYLQATLVTIEPEVLRLHINLTPGVAVAGEVMAVIDGNKDGVISTNEGAAYAEALKRDLIVRFDERLVPLKLAKWHLPAPGELKTGEGVIQMEFSATMGVMTAGTHRVAVENRHLPKVSVYLLNATLPKTEAVRITKQKRNKNQSTGEIEFGFDPVRR